MALLGNMRKPADFLMRTTDRQNYTRCAVTVGAGYPRPWAP